MADKRIDQLTAATSLTAVDLMVTEQSGIAKKVTGDILANSAWNMMQKDASPTKDSTAPVTSGAVYDALGGVFSPTKLATPGALVHFEDGAYNQPVQGMKIAVNPVQSMNGYDHPWPAGGGKNILDVAGRTISGSLQTPETIRAEACTVTKDGDTLTGTVTGSWSKMWIEIDTNTLLDGQTYTLSAKFSNPSGGTVGISWYDTAWHDITTSTSISVKLQASFTYDTSKTKITLGFIINNTNTNTGYTVVVSEMQLEKGSTASSYAPYENLCPISGWDAVGIGNSASNLIDAFAVANGFLQPTNGVVYDNQNWNVTPFISARGGDYTLSWDSAVFIYQGTICAYDANQHYITGVNWSGGAFSHTFTLPFGTSYLRASWSVAVNGNPAVRNNIRLNFGSADLGYTPYVAGSTYSITFPTSAGTVYGGTLDVVNGKMTVDRAMVDLGTLAWSYVNSIFVATLPSNSYKYASSVKALSDRYAFVGAIQNGTIDMQGKADCSFALYYNANYPTSRAVYVKNTAYTDAAAFKTAMDGAQLVYELATPIEITLTPTQIDTLLGTNNIWADCGDIEELAYRADIGLYLTGALNPIKEMLANREDTMKATRAYSAGDYIIVGNTFYRVATAIANGATLTPGTNVSATTVGAQLKLLS